MFARRAIDGADRALRIVMVHHIGQARHLAVGGIGRCYQGARVRPFGGNFHHGAHKGAGFAVLCGFRLGAAGGYECGR